jgi:hypothetical protein
MSLKFDGDFLKHSGSSANVRQLPAHPAGCAGAKVDIAILFLGGEAHLA